MRGKDGLGRLMAAPALPAACRRYRAVSAHQRSYQQAPFQPHPSASSQPACAQLFACSNSVSCERDFCCAASRGRAQDRRTASAAACRAARPWNFHCWAARSQQGAHLLVL